MTLTYSEHSQTPGASTCRSCAAALSAGQRYCVNCGSRQGAPRVESGPVLAALASASLAARKAGELPPVEAHAAQVAGASPIADNEELAGVAAVGTSIASRPAAFAGMALLTIGMIFGSAFSPPVQNTLAAAQRVVIVQAPGAPAQGPPAAAPTIDPGGAVSEPPVVVTPIDTGVVPQPTPSPSPTPPPGPTPKPLPTDPRIGHMVVVLLPGGGVGQTLVAGPARRGHASDAVSYGSAFSTLAAKGFLLKGFRHVSTGGFANRIALVTGMKPTAEMAAGCIGPVTLVKDGAGCIVPDDGGDPIDIATLATQNLATKSQAIRAYVETPTASSGDYTSLCHPVAEGALGSAPTDGTPPVSDNPLLWIRGITGEPADWTRDSLLCTDKGGQQGMIRPTSMLAKDLSDAYKADSERFDTTAPSNFPLITVIVPSRCRVDATVKCPDGTSGGPEALKRFLDTVIGGTLAGSSLFKKDGAAVIAWDQAPATNGRHAHGSKTRAHGHGAAASTLPAAGALIISPFVKAGSSSTKAYDTYDLMLTLEERLHIAGTGLGETSPLGESKTANPFGRDVFPAR